MSSSIHDAINFRHVSSLRMIKQQQQQIQTNNNNNKIKMMHEFESGSEMIMYILSGNCGAFPPGFPNLKSFSFFFYLKTKAIQCETRNTRIDSIYRKLSSGISVATSLLHGVAQDKLWIAVKLFSSHLYALPDKVCPLISQTPPPSPPPLLTPPPKHKINKKIQIIKMK